MTNPDTSFTASSVRLQTLLENAKRGDFSCLTFSAAGCGTKSVSGA